MIGRAIGRWWTRSRGRIAAGAWSSALAAVAAALAWFLAHDLLDHKQPFFAPIAAAISISTSRIQRGRRIAQMVAGVLLGIGVGELLVDAIGSSTVAIGVIVFVTMLVALATGVGFFSEGMMFANQAAASAILVAAVHRIGTGAERGIDALVGGGVALGIGVLLFPAHPLSILREAEQSVLEVIARTLRELEETQSIDDERLLQSARDLSRELTTLNRARATARLNAKIAPRRWRLRGAVEEESRRLTQLELEAVTVLGIAQAAHARGNLTPDRE